MKQKPESSKRLGGESKSRTAGVSEKKTHSRAYRWARRVSITLVLLLVVGAVGLVGADYYTTRPNFCGTCHVMDPYFESWSRDLHGARLGVLCVDCHYAPGERFTIHAKFKGLSQVASYFSGRYGAGRPRAHVADESCLVSGCHGERSFMSKLLPIGEPRMEGRVVDGVTPEVMRAPTVHFFHEKHLDVAARLEENAAAVSEIADAFRQQLASDAYERLGRAVRSVAPADRRATELADLVAELALSSESRTQALQWSELTHRRTRLKQLDSLHCASCHSYDATGDEHLAVNQQVCFNCHFANERFNQGTGECLKCHEPPTRAIVVHAPTDAQASQTVVMDHQDVLQRGVKCASCHLDVVRGNATVTRRECAHCHDSDEFLVDFDQRDTDRVAEYHAIHVAEQRARCEDCHQTVTHGLLKSIDIASDSAFLDLVLEDCQHCHPAHHTEQVHMLMGTGGSGVDRAVPNAMLGSRLNCRACHTQSGEDFKGEPLIRASGQSCVQCHSPDYIDLFGQWHHEIAQYLESAEQRLVEFEQALADVAADQTALPADVTALLDRARHNTRLVKVGGGLHNRAFALQLLDVARGDLDQVAKRVAEMKAATTAPE
jgi:nitrate/TMAO reductase-like tetraheme cytochrome c subunit